LIEHVFGHNKFAYFRYSTHFNKKARVNAVHKGFGFIAGRYNARKTSNMN